MAINERLRDSMSTQGVTSHSAAETLGVDPKTVERWITTNRLPYPRHRRNLATLLKESVDYLWPEASNDTNESANTQSELIKLYNRRVDIPLKLWDHLLESAQERIDIMACSGMFLFEQTPDLIARLQAKEEQGVKVRVLVSDPNSTAIKQRAIAEGHPDLLMGSVLTTYEHFEAWLSCSNTGAETTDPGSLQARTYDANFATSIYRYDETMLASHHLYALAESQSPTLHLRRAEGGALFDRYVESLEAAWREGSLMELSKDETSANDSEVAIGR